ncbi:MAG: hypothetical protein AAB686_01110, partial [Patescibacteria group bacterium]
MLGVVGSKVYKVSNERPLPGEKLATGVELPVQNDQGFLGSFNPKQKATFALAVEIERRSDLHVVWAEGRDRQIRALGDQTPGVETAVFSKRIPTDKTLSGDYVTKSTDNLGNGVWAVSTTGGQLQMWEVAVVTIVANGQSRFYLSLQKVYAAMMYYDRSADPVAPVFISDDQFPGYGDWSNLRGFLEEVVDLSVLKPVAEYKPSKKRGPGKLTGDQAEIIWFNQAKGFGFARVEGEDPNPNFRRSQVTGQEFPAFEPEQIIRYSFLNRT